MTSQFDTMSQFDTWMEQGRAAWHGHARLQIRRECGEPDGVIGRPLIVPGPGIYGAHGHRCVVCGHEVDHPLLAHEVAHVHDWLARHRAYVPAEHRVEAVVIADAIAIWNQVMAHLFTFPPTPCPFCDRPIVALTEVSMTTAGYERGSCGLFHDPNRVSRFGACELGHKTLIHMRRRCDDSYAPSHDESFGGVSLPLKTNRQPCDWTLTPEWSPRPDHATLVLDRWPDCPQDVDLYATLTTERKIVLPSEVGLVQR